MYFNTFTAGFSEQIKSRRYSLDSYSRKVIRTMRLEIRIIGCVIFLSNAVSVKYYTNVLSYILIAPRGCSA